VQRANGPVRFSSLEAQGREIVERLGGEWQRKSGMCRCPAHDDRTPSLSVRLGERQLLFHCFAGCETTKVIRALSAMQLLARDGAARTGGTGESPADPGRRNRGAAARLWAAARSIDHSPAEAYLRSRGLTLTASDLRYHSRTPYGRGLQVIFRPAMLAALRDETGLVAVHRTFLDPRSAWIADLPLPKRALGRLGQGAVRLHPPRDGLLGLAEGIETAMAATELTGVPCWAALGTERFSHVALPASVKRLILFLDNDAGGRRAEKLARETHRGTGTEIEARYPKAGGADWNDVLLQDATPMS
jgi:putative DNA primase/helicase